MDYSYYYKKFNRKFGAKYPYFDCIIKPVLVNLPFDASVLEVGCGNGELLSYLKLVGYQNAVGIDTSAEQINIAKENVPNAYYVENSIDFLENRTEEYDLIVAIDVLEHLSKKDAITFVKKINSALRLGGKIILTTPNANSIFAARYIFGDITHETAYTENSLDVLLNDAYFDGISIKDSEWKPRSMIDLFGLSGIRWMLLRPFRMARRVSAILELGPVGATIPLALNLIAVAYKK